MYLRTFTDDSLTIRTATYARQSLLDQLSPRRFGRFAEVPVRNLTVIGPIAARNPPSTGDHRNSDQRTEWAYAEALIVATTMATSPFTTPEPDTNTDRESVVTPLGPDL